MSHKDWLVLLFNAQQNQDFGRFSIDMEIILEKSEYTSIT